MFNADFFPTPEPIIEQLTAGLDLNGLTILEPSAGSGNMVEYCLREHAKVIACELDPKLRTIVESKCKVIADDFLTVKADQISHVDAIIMNPPFSADEKHILHAWEIAPDGCEVRALCNIETINNQYSRTRRVLGQAIKSYGSTTFLGDCFSDSERKTGVEVAMVRLFKPKAQSEDEFEGFFIHEEEEEQSEGLMSYNFIRDLVGRYIGAIRIFDEQLESAVRMNNLTSQFYSSNIALSLSKEKAVLTRADYKKDLQKSAWKFVFQKLNMEKYITQGVKSDINKFVEKQTSIPFTMKNIYRMIEIIVGTQKDRMDRALVDVFEKITTHYDENRYQVEGWKTNSHYLVGQKFILPGIVELSWSGELSCRYGSYQAETVEDFLKALCYITGKDYNSCSSLYERMNGRDIFFRDGKKFNKSFYSDTDRQKYLSENPEVTMQERPKFGEWFDWEFFEVKGFKKGTLHFKFKDLDIWGRFNQHIARIKGYPLFEPKKTKKAA